MPRTSDPQGVPVGALIEAGARILGTAGIAEPRRRARQIVEALTGLDTASVLAGASLIDAATAVRCRAGLQRFAGGEPLSRIAGQREFWGLTLAVAPATLDPRPDTETLVAAVVELLPDRGLPLALADLGTGTGAVALALLVEYPHATVVAVDRSEAALATAASNARRHGLHDRFRPLCADWLAPVAGRFHAIVANPPYIPSADLDGLEPAVGDYDPALALDGGADGLDAYRAIGSLAGRNLAPSGWLVLECGDGMADRVADTIGGAGSGARCRRFTDLAGHERVVACRPR